MQDDDVVELSHDTGVSFQTVLDSWSPDYRDVIIVDSTNTHVATYNLTTYDLQVATNYDALTQLLIDIAEGNYP
jgi:phosphoenolpyruvate carboxylase